MRGDRIPRAPVRVVRRRDEAGTVASAALFAASSAVGRGGRVVAGRVRGRRVRVVGMWPPRENVVRWRNKWPCKDFGSVHLAYQHTPS